MKYFSINELTKSSTAIRQGINNTPPQDAVVKMTALVDNILDPLREAYGKPIVVDSGYRCAKLNKQVKGSATSQHLTGEAADIRSVSDNPKDNKEIFDLIVKLGLPFDQLINEYDYNWVHVSFSKRNRRQKLKAVKQGGKTAYIAIK